MKISVVIPTFRRVPLLMNCLRALSEQSFNSKEYEVLIVSDGPDAATEKAVKEFSFQHPQFQFLHTTERKGPAAARNLGWQNAKGTLIAFTDDDTLPAQDWLNKFWEAYHGEKEIAFTGIVKVPTSLQPTDFEKNTAGLEDADFVTANCGCTKAALEKTGGFDEAFSMAWREDSDLEFKLIVCDIPIRYKVNALVVHPVRSAPWGVSIKEQKKTMFNALLYKKYPTLYRQKIQKAPRWDYYLMVASLLLLLTGLVLQLTWLSIVAFGCWLVLTIAFIVKRLASTSKRVKHVLEMIATSIVIPFASVYWRLYGAWKYRVLFL